MKIVVVMMLTLISLAFVGNTSFASLTAQQAKRLTKDSILQINLTRIEEAAYDGKCSTEGFELKPDDENDQALIKLGYLVLINMTTGKSTISWCDGF